MQAGNDFTRGLLLEMTIPTHKPAVCPCGQEGQGCPGVHEKEHGQNVEGGDLPPLLCPGEVRSGVLCPVLVSTVQERQETSTESNRVPERLVRIWSISIMRKI